MPQRKFTEADYPNFARAMASDPEHASLRPEDFAYEPRTEMHVWEDKLGPVFYFRLSREIRIDIQFDNEVSKARIQSALIEGLEWLEKLVRPKYRALTFDSVYRPLKIFAMRVLNFKEWPDLRKGI